MFHYDFHHQKPSTISNQTSSSKPSITTSSPISPSSSSSKSTTDPESQVGSIFGFGENILKPFMGLHNINRRDDPWNYKAYNLYQPIFTGGGTFEEPVKTSRFRRDASNISNFHSAGSFPNITSQSLDNLLDSKTYYKENHTLFHNSLINNNKSTAFSITPPQQPTSYRDIELAAAEINHLETLKDTYEEDLQKIFQNQYQQNNRIKQPLSNFYNSEINFYDINKAPKTLQSVSAYDHYPLNTSNIANDNRIWDTSQESFLPPNKQQSDLHNPHKSIIKNHNISKEHIQDSSFSYWHKLQEILKTLNIQDDITQDTNDSMHYPLILKNEEHNLWSSLNEPSAVNKRNSFWTDLEEEEELREHHQYHFDDLEPIFNVDEDFD